MSDQLVFHSDVGGTEVAKIPNGHIRRIGFRGSYHYRVNVGGSIRYEGPDLHAATEAAFAGEGNPPEPELTDGRAAALKAALPARKGFFRDV